MSSLDRRNRLVVTVVAVLLLAAGGYGLARGWGVVGGDDGAGPVFDDDLRRSMVDNAGWFAGAAVFVALVLAWLGWRWLRLQLAPSNSLHALQLATADGGRTSLEAQAVADAVQRDVEQAPGVALARVRLVGHARSPALEVRAEVASGADPASVRRHVEDYVVPRARAALQHHDLGATVRLRLADPNVRSLD